MSYHKNSTWFCNFSSIHYDSTSATHLLLISRPNWPTNHATTSKSNPMRFSVQSRDETWNWQQLHLTYWIWSFKQIYGRRYGGDIHKTRHTALRQRKKRRAGGTLELGELLTSGLGLSNHACGCVERLLPIFFFNSFFFYDEDNFVIARL